MHALLVLPALALIVAAPPETLPPEAMLCDVASELKLAVMHGSEAEMPAAALTSVLARYGCLKVFALPSGIAMMGDSLPEGASRIADRIGVDWIITVSPESSPGYVTARLIETSNLLVMKAATGRDVGVADALLVAIYDDLKKAQTEGFRVNLVLEPSTYGLARGMENAVRGVKNVTHAGAARITEGRSLVVVQYLGPVDRLADALEQLPIGKSKLEVVQVKLRRIELRPVLP
jgi:hypothetical protein